MKIVYIAGLGQSGSTILDMVLGSHPEIVGLGEIYQLLNVHGNELTDKASRYNNLLCSCGKRINDCFFWKGAKQLLIDNKYLSGAEKYQKIVDHFRSIYGDKWILVDSSKVAGQQLKHINSTHDLKIIFLVRDFRSWSYSRKRKFGTNALLSGYQWARMNWGVSRFLKMNHFNYLTVGYEEMALYPDIMLKKICKFIDVEYDPCMLFPINTKSHIIEGNAARADDEKRACIRYDARWITSLSMAFYSVLLFPLLIVNRRLVYSNFLKKKKVVAFGRKGDDFMVFSAKKKEETIKRTERIDL